MDKIRSEHQNPDGEALVTNAQQRLDAMLIQHATQPGQGDRITKMADVMYRVAKTLEPFDGKNRTHILEEVQKQFVAKGEAGARSVLEKGGVGGQLIEKLQHDLDVLNLVKERPKYVRQLEWVEKTWGAVAIRDWLGTDRHKAMAAGIDATLPVDRFVAEVVVESLTHKAWSAIKDTVAIRREYLDDVVPMMAATLDWTRTGCPVFSLTDDFFHALAVTDFGTSDDEKEDVLHMPFPAFVVNFPPNSLLADVRRMFVFRVADTTLGEALSREKIKVGDTVDTVVTAEMDVAWSLTRLVMASDGMLFTQWPSTTTRWDFFHDKNLARDGEKVPQEVLERISMARRILANMLSYIEANHGLPREKHRHGATAAPVEREHTEPRFRVGRTVKLSPQIRMVLKEGRAGRSWKLGHRYIVRGHWRNQAHGPARSLRTRKWIEPFWKGPASMDEALERNYSVE